METNKRYFTVYAYQMKMNEDGQTVDRCWHLSDTEGGPGVWSLINTDNPSEGVMVSYLDGDYETDCGHNRQFDIKFVCDNDHGAFGIPGEAHSEIAYVANGDIGSVREDEICQYQLEFHTVYGCPRYDTLDEQYCIISTHCIQSMSHCWHKGT